MNATQKNKVAGKWIELEIIIVRKNAALKESSRESSRP
jgi:hypothetical protein